MGCLLLGARGCAKYQESRKALTCREMHAVFSEYRMDHGGAMPRNLQELVHYARASMGGFATLDTGEEWTAFVYVANLTTNDPRGSPVIIDVPARRTRHRGIVGDYAGRALWLPNDELQGLIREPWLLIQDDFEDEAALEEFKQRVRVVLPDGMRTK